jgi:hypothetical protein
MSVSDYTANRKNIPTARYFKYIPFIFHQTEISEPDVILFRGNRIDAPRFFGRFFLFLPNDIYIDDTIKKLKVSKRVYRELKVLLFSKIILEGILFVLSLKTDLKETVHVIGYQQGKLRQLPRRSMSVCITTLFFCCPN